MKRIVIAVFSLMLVLTGCAQNVAPVGEAMKNSFDWTSVQAKSEISFSSNLPKDQLDPQGRLFLELLEKGLVLESKQQTKQNGYAVLSANDPSSLINTDLWPYATAPAIEIYANGYDSYMKSSVDNKFLALETDSPAAPTEEMNLLAKQMLTSYIDQFDYTFKNVETVGSETVALPNGTNADATHIRITMDLPEALTVTSMALDNLSQLEELDALAKLLTGPAFSAGGTNPAPSSEDLKNGLSMMAAQLKTLNGEQLQELGFTGQLVLDYWVSNDDQLVQQKTNISMNLPGSVDPTVNLDQVHIDLNFSNQYWNQNQPVNITFPTADQIVTNAQLKNDKSLLNSFPQGSPVHFLAEAMLFVPPFTDVTPDYWAYDQIQALKEQEIISGYYGDDQFKPNQAITRAEFIAMTVNALGVETQSAELSFNDKNEIPGWAESYMQTAVKTGLVTGYEDGTIRPNQPISRAEMVAILVKGLNLPLAEDTSLSFTDGKNIPNWAVQYVKTASDQGLISGYEDGSFGPFNQAKRGEVAAVIYNAIMK